MKKIIILSLVLGLAGVAIALFALSNHPAVPAAIQKQVNFFIFYPQPNSQTTIQEKTFKYDPSTKQVSFVISYMNRQVTFAEQSSPDAFADDPNIYPQFIQKLNSYSTFDSVNGRVDLTRPKQVNGQAGVMNSKGTLMFASLTKGTLTEDQWKQLFNSIQFTKPG